MNVLQYFNEGKLVGCVIMGGLQLFDKEKCDLLFVRTNPPTENTLSLAVLVAGMHKIFLASLASKGIADFFLVPKN